MIATIMDCQMIVEVEVVVVAVALRMRTALTKMMIACIQTPVNNCVVSLYCINISSLFGIFKNNIKCISIPCVLCVSAVTIS